MDKFTLVVWLPLLLLQLFIGWVLFDVFSILTKQFPKQKKIKNRKIKIITYNKENQRLCDSVIVFKLDNEIHTAKILPKIKKASTTLCNCLTCNYCEIRCKDVGEWQVCQNYLIDKTVRELTKKELAELTAQVNKKIPAPCCGYCSKTKGKGE